MDDEKYIPKWESDMLDLLKRGRLEEVYKDPSERLAPFGEVIQLKPGNVLARYKDIYKILGLSPLALGLREGEE